jgi:F0F1-type ATP synthase membrane subunit b/b'
VFRSQEARRQAALQARATAVAEARKIAQAQVQTAKQDIELDKEKAKWGLQEQVSTLAAEIVRRVLQPAGDAR